MDVSRHVRVVDRVQVGNHELLHRVGLAIDRKRVRAPKDLRALVRALQRDERPRARSLLAKVTQVIIQKERNDRLAIEFLLEDGSTAFHKQLRERCVGIRHAFLNHFIYHICTLKVRLFHIREMRLGEEWILQQHLEAVWKAHLCF